MNVRLVKKLEALTAAFEERKPEDLKRLGADLIGEAALRNDKGLARISVVAYSLYKILSRRHFVMNRRWPYVSENIDSELVKGMRALEKGNNRLFNTHLEHVIRKIEGIDEELSNYAKNIHAKAKTKQASTAYALGLSLNQAASLTGADARELQKYIGYTRIHDEHPTGAGIAKRLQSIKGLLGK